MELIARKTASAKVVVAVVAGVLGISIGIAVALALGVPATASQGAAGTSATMAPFAAPPAAAVISAPPYPKNALGMTYGSGLTDGSQAGPDLIAAYGVGGVFGYVKATDLPQPAKGTPAEALKTQMPAETSIPLYAEDGVTVIGSYQTHDDGTGRGDAVTRSTP